MTGGSSEDSQTLIPSRYKAKYNSQCLTQSALDKCNNWFSYRPKCNVFIDKHLVIGQECVNFHLMWQLHKVSAIRNGILSRNVAPTEEQRWKLL